MVLYIRAMHAMVMFVRVIYERKRHAMVSYVSIMHVKGQVM
jgi:hypothetical protein